MKIFSRLAATLVLVCAAFAFQASLARAYTLTVVDGIDVKDWDPAIAYGHESYVLNNIYDPLTRYNTKEGKLEPALATSWSVSDDGKQWTFKLRPGVKFHSGEPMTAKSIKAMLDRNIKMGQGAHYLWGGATVDGTGRRDPRDHHQGSPAHRPGLLGLLCLHGLFGRRGGQGDRVVPEGQCRRHRPLQAGAVGTEPADRARAQQGLLARLEGQ